MAERRWEGKTYGNGWMHRTLVRMLRFVDVRIIYLFSDIFVVPFCVVFNRSRRSAWYFYRHRMGFGFFKSVHMTWRNHCMFSQVVIDRFAMYAGRRFKVQIVGEDLFAQFSERPEGFLQLSSHIGNYEIAGYSLRSGKGIHAVVYSNEKESVMQGRSSMFSKTNVSMIALKEDMSHLFEIDSAICSGDIVSFPSDRYMAGSKCVTTHFLGKDAKFPLGPFSVAAMRGVDVLAVNVMKSSLTGYRIYMTQLHYDKNLPRKDQTSQLCRAYAAELERMLRMYPSQWFNFYDFWA